MRAKQIYVVVMTATLLATSGCKTSSPGWSWNRKGAAANSTPQLPSASATPAATPNHQYANNAAHPGGSPYPDPNAVGANPYATSPYAGAASPYAAPGAPPAAATGATPPGSPYAAANAAAPPAYGAAPGVAPQVGPYNENVGAPPAAGGYAAAPPAGSAYPATAAPPAGTPPATAQPPGGTAYPANATANAASAAPYGGGAYGSAGAVENASPPATDNRYTDRYATSGEPPATDRAAAGDTNTTDPAANAMANRYQPGANSYNPGQTGYNPPGVTPYQMPAQANVSNPSRRDPYYRPGGTGDYVLGGSQTSAATVADRYGVPASGAAGSESGATLPPR